MNAERAMKIRKTVKARRTVKAGKRTQSRKARKATTAGSVVAFSNEQATRVLMLLKGANSFELKFVVPCAGDRATMAGIGLAQVEVQPVQAFLKRRAGQSYILAMAAKKVNKPKDAVKAYMDAVRLDSTVLLKEDQGLREMALKAMRATVEKRPERTDLHFLLGVYSQAAGESSTAIKSFQDCMIHEKDPYLRWRAEAWLKYLQR